MASPTSIPASRVPLLDTKTGLMSTEWYRFLFSQFGQTGGGTTALSLSDLELAPPASSGTEALYDEVQGLLAAPPYVPVPLCIGTFAAMALQTLGAANTATAVTFDTTIYSAGIGLSATSRVTPGRAGTYLVAFEADIDKTTGGGADVYLWLRKNGTDLANTARKTRVQGVNSEVEVGLVLSIPLAQTDYIEVMWAATDINVTLAVAAATAFSPAGPSALLTVTQVDL
jgi:hypothetical protein